MIQRRSRVSVAHGATPAPSVSPDLKGLNILARRTSGRIGNLVPVAGHCGRSGFNTSPGTGVQCFARTTGTARMRRGLIPAPQTDRR